MSQQRSLGDSVTAGSNSTLRFYRKKENQKKRGQLRSSNSKEERRGNAMMHTSGLLRVTDVHKGQRCVVVIMLV